MQVPGLVDSISKQSIGNLKCTRNNAYGQEVNTGIPKSIEGKEKEQGKAN